MKKFFNLIISFIQKNCTELFYEQNKGSNVCELSSKKRELLWQVCHNAYVTIILSDTIRLITTLCLCSFWTYIHDIFMINVYFL